MDPEKTFSDLPNIAIFWDIENITPKHNSFFIDGLLEFAENLGKVVISNAYADWSKPGFKRLGPNLSQHNFYMVHLPHRNKRSTKNAVDIQLVSDALDTLRVYQHIDTYLLVTGDSDFRPLLRPLRRMGKKIHIVCDVRTASQDLLMIADSFTDHHSLIPGSDEDDDLPEGRETQRHETFSKKQQNRNIDYWYNQLVETIHILEQEHKPLTLGSIKIKMRMLNQGFDERNLGFHHWSQFIAGAVKRKFISVDEHENELSIRTMEPKSGNNTVTLQKAFKELIEIMKLLDGQSETSAEEPNAFHPFSTLNSRLREKNINVRELGFAQFKKFMDSAETRNLVETKLENLNRFAKLI